MFDLVAKRLKLAQQHYRESYGKSSAQANGTICRKLRECFCEPLVQGWRARLTKVRLAAAIRGVISRLGRTQAQAAEKLGISQPKVSALVNYKLEGFSVERLMHFLTALDQDIEVVIRDKSRSRRMGKIVVRGASQRKRLPA